MAHLPTSACVTDKDGNGTIDLSEMTEALSKAQEGTAEEMEVRKMICLAKDITDKSDTEIMAIPLDELKVRERETESTHARHHPTVSSFTLRLSCSAHLAGVVG